MKINVTLGFLLLLILSVNVNADTGANIIDTIFLPKEYYVGDKVELRIKLNIEDGYNLKPPALLPDSSWVTINSVEITDLDKIPELKIIFTSFSPGTRSLPALTLGTIVLNSVKIHTSSLITSRKEGFIGIADQALLPGTKLGLALVIGLLFIGPLFFILLLGPVRTKVSQMVKNNIGRRPIRRLNKILHELEDQKDGISCRRFYIKLSGAVREYLSKRTNIDFITLTTSDMGPAFLKVLNSVEWAEKLSGMMRLSDSIKFGKFRTNDAGMMIDIDLVRKMSISLEAEIKRKKSRSLV